jgi:site-specific DNA-adenine methylase
MPDGYFQTNTIYCGDCKDVLTRFPEGAVDLIYVDPLFSLTSNMRSYGAMDTS